MRVLVYEPKFVGHFLGFAVAAARAYAEAGCEVTLGLSTHAEDSEPARIKLAELPDGVRVRYACDVPKIYKKWENARLEAAGLHACLDQAPVDWLASPSADFLLNGLLLDGRLRRRVARLRGADLVLHNCRSTYPKLGLRETPSLWLDRLAVTLSSGLRLHTVDEYAISDAAPGRIGLWGAPVEHLPHFYDRRPGPIDQDQARRRLGLDAGVRWIGSAGDLGRRKGTELLIDSFAAASVGNDHHLALFGLLSSTAKETLAKYSELVKQGRIVARDRYVTEDDFRDFFPAMDVVWAGYPRQVGMASTLLFAADAERPVIAIDYGGVSWMVREYALGVVCQANRATVAGVIRDSMDAPTKPAGAQRFLQRHTTAGFNECLTEGVREAMSAETRTPEAIT